MQDIAKDGGAVSGLMYQIQDMHLLFAILQVKHTSFLK